MFEEFVREGIDSSFSSQSVNLWAKQIANEYIGNEKESLNEKIAKIASVNGLNAEQVQRIVEATNLAVDSVKKGSDFELAKTAAVMMIVKKPGLDELPEMPGIEDFMAPPEAKEQDVNIHELFGVGEQNTNVVPKAKSIQIKIIKLADAKKALADHVSNLLFQKDASEKELVKVAKQCVLGDHENINNLYEMICDIGLEKMAKHYFPIINHVLVSQGVLEKTAYRAPEELISDRLDNNGISQIRITNGNHAIVKTFQTMKKIEDDIVHARKAIILVEDKIKKLKEEAKRIS